MTTTEEKKEVPLGMREFYPYASQYLGSVLKELGVEIAFGIHGGHIWQIVDGISEAGIKIITFRHEQSAFYAAEGYSKVTNKPGVAFATVGPGVANSVSAVQQAFISCSPVICLYYGGRTRKTTPMPFSPLMSMTYSATSPNGPSGAFPKLCSNTTSLRPIRTARSTPKGPSPWRFR